MADIALNYPPAMFSLEERVAMATRCHDADCVPKVADAGKVLTINEGERVQIMHNGLRVVADGYCGTWMTDLIRLCHGHHEIQEERMFYEVERHLSDDAVMIELGGYWSYYSLWFLYNSPQRHAIVVEPDPAHMNIGVKNAALNHLAPKFIPGFAGEDHIPSVPFNTEDSGVIDLPRLSVPHIMKQQGIKKLSLLHCDIQGAETQVLNSCRELFYKEMVDWVFVSTHAHQISGDPLTHEKCLSILRDCGAVIEAEHDVHESFSGDGLIVARFCPSPKTWRPVELTYNRQSQSLFRHLAYDLAACREELRIAQEKR